MNGAQVSPNPKSLALLRRVRGCMQAFEASEQIYEVQSIRNHIRAPLRCHQKNQGGDTKIVFIRDTKNPQTTLSEPRCILFYRSDTISSSDKHQTEGPHVLPPSEPSQNRPSDILGYIQSNR